MLFVQLFSCLFIRLPSRCYLYRYCIVWLNNHLYLYLFIYLFVLYWVNIIIQLYLHCKMQRALSSVVEHRTAVPVVTGSIPVVPFFIIAVKNVKEKSMEASNTTCKHIKVKTSSKLVQLNDFILFHSFHCFQTFNFSYCLFISYFLSSSLIVYGSMVQWQHMRFWFL